MARLVRSTFDGLIDQEITVEQAHAEIAAVTRIRGPEYVEGDLESEVTLWAKALNGRPIAPVRIWWHKDGVSVPPWHQKFFGQIYAAS
jgi:hypothetical protein